VDQINDLAGFVAVAETNSFAAAARRLSITTAGVSKSVLRLEARLGVRLFTRTTRRVALTSEGERFYARSRDILESLAEAEAEIKDAATDIRGRIRIDMPAVFGDRYVLPELAKFRDQHPGVMFDIRMSDTISNLVEENVDLAVRFGDLSDSRLKFRNIGPSRMATCASPAYLAKRGVPKSVDDLSKHDCISFVFRSSGRAYKWRFNVDGATTEFQPNTNHAVNDILAYHRLALLGEGIIQDLASNLLDDVSSGRLVEILKHNSADAFPLALVWPAGRHQTQRVCALIDFLTPQLQAVIKVANSRRKT
jgi:LysR family transcriptional regulator, regulator for bpeEF and oprC